jgi:mycothiol synthase
MLLACGCAPCWGTIRFGGVDVVHLHHLRHESDYRRVQELLSDNASDGSLGPYPTPADLDFRRYLEGQPEDTHQVVLWEDEAGRLIGFTWPSEDDSMIVSRHGFSEVEESMLVWSERHAIASGLHTCNVYAYTRDTRRVELVQRHFYRRTETYCWYGRRVLSDAIAVQPLPEGFVLRSLNLGDRSELDQRGLLHGLAASSTVTAAQYARMTLEARQYRNDLDLVVVGANGVLAAFSTAWYDERSRRGLIEPYGCSPLYRRHGLARALLTETLRRLQMLGARDVVIAHGDCDSEEEDASLQLNRSVGFEPFGRDYLWQHKLEEEARTRE